MSAQFADKVRIGQKANVQDHIGVVWDAVLVTKRGQKHVHAAGIRRLAKSFLHFPLELMHVQAASVDYLVSQFTHCLERPALTRNPFLNRLLACERMRSPGLTEPPQQDFIRSVEKEHLDVVSGFAHIGQNIRQSLEKLPGSQVYAKSDPSDSFVVTD